MPHMAIIHGMISPYEQVTWGQGMFQTSLTVRREVWRVQPSTKSFKPTTGSGTKRSSTKSRF